MTHAERYIRTVRFEPVDRLPFFHSFGLLPGVLEDWHAQGLPADVRSHQDIIDYFGFDAERPGLPVNIKVDPPTPERVLEETPEYRIAIDSLGRRTKMYVRNTSVPLPLEYPVKDWDTWRAYKPRIEFSARRLGANLEAVAAAHDNAGLVNRIGGWGFFGLPRELLGTEEMCAAFYEQPDMLGDIINTFCDMLVEVISATVQRIRVDEIYLAEDMAYHSASMISRAMFEEFLAPCYRRVRELVQKHRIPVFSVDSDGCVVELAEWLNEYGVNLLMPMEARAGNDLPALRQRFGRRLAFGGGLEKLTLTKDPEAIEQMLQQTIPAMKASGGGWCIGLDHRVVPGTTLENFRYYTDRVNQLRDF